MIWIVKSILSLMFCLYKNFENKTNTKEGLWIQDSTILIGFIQNTYNFVRGKIIFKYVIFICTICDIVFMVWFRTSYICTRCCLQIAKHVKDLWSDCVLTFTKSSGGKKEVRIYQRPQ